MKITDLPEWAIREIIDYILTQNISCLTLPALAMTTDSASWKEAHWNKSSPKSILTYRWHVRMYQFSCLRYLEEVRINPTSDVIISIIILSSNYLHTLKTVISKPSDHYYF